MEQSVYRLLCNIPTQLIVFVTVLQMVKIRNIRLFAVELFILTSLTVLIGIFHPALTTFRAIAGFLIYCVLIATNADCGMLKSLLAATLLYTAMLLSEVAADCALIAICGGGSIPSLINDNLRLAFGLQCMFWVIQAAVSLFLVRKWNRFGHQYEDNHYGKFVLLPLSQGLIIAQSVLLSGTVSISDSKLFLLMFFEAAAAFLIDLFLLRAHRQYLQTILTKERSQLLNERLQKELEYYHTVTENVKNTAKVRHDLRNQIQTVKYLADSGNRTDAMKELDEMITYTEELGKRS